MEGDNLDFPLPKRTERNRALIPLSYTKCTKFDSAGFSH